MRSVAMITCALNINGKFDKAKAVVLREIGKKTRDCGEREQRDLIMNKEGRFKGL